MDMRVKNDFRLTTVMSAGATEKERAADSLRAMTLALMLEPLGVDASLGTPALDEIAEEVSQLSQVDGEQIALVGAALSQLVQAAASVRRHRLQITAVAQQLGVQTSANSAELCQEWLGHPEFSRHLRSLDHLPAEALRIDANQIAAAEQAVRDALQLCRRTNRSWPAEIKREITQLDLDDLIDALRDKGFLFFHGRSDAARRRTLQHALETAKTLSNSALAARLSLVREHRDARAGLEEVLSAQPAWYRWLVDQGSFRIRRSRADALTWILMRRDADALPEAALDLLADVGWRQVMRRMEGRHIDGGPRVRENAFGSTALRRLRVAFQALPDTSIDELDAWVAWVTEQMDLLSRLANTLDSARSDPRLAKQLAAVADGVSRSHGPLDRSRGEYAALLWSLQQALDGALSTSTERVRVIEQGQLLEVARTLSALERAVRQTTQGTPAVQGLLQVAIAGRTKSGKTTLRKALTRDADRAGIGRGAHRTTRETATFEIDSVRYLDTPGVAAYDDDFDAEKAWQACLAADAVIWNYADALRTEEAAYVQGLLAVGKPVLVVVNVKWRVDSKARLALFARRPDMAFRHQNGHVQRINEIANAVDAPSPVVLPVHSGAAHEALCCGDDDLAASALDASRIHEVENQLRALLTERAVPLRAIRLADQLRTPLASVDGLITEQLPATQVTLDTLERTAGRHQKDLLQAVDRAGRHAHASLDAKQAQAQQDLHRLVRKLGGKDSQRRWQSFVMSLDLPDVGRELERQFERELARMDRHLTAEWKAEWRAGLRSLRTGRRPGSRWIRRVFLGAWGAVLGILKGFRGPQLVAKLGEAELPWLLIAQVAGDALGGAARKISQDIDEARVEHQTWTETTATAAKRELDRIIDKTRAELSTTVVSAKEQVVYQFGRQRVDVAAARDRIRRLRRAQRHVRETVNQCDLVLAKRLVQLVDADPSVVIGARRVPGRALTLWVRPEHAAAIAERLGAMLDGVLREQLTLNTPATRRRWPRLRQRQTDDAHD